MSNSSVQMHTPRKSVHQLFDAEDTSLASDINSYSAALPDDKEADRTELEMLEDIFYV